LLCDYANQDIEGKEEEKKRDKKRRRGNYVERKRNDA
jgi:hypothetical protein